MAEAAENAQSGGEYTKQQKILHWAVVAMVALQLLVGPIMANLMVEGDPAAGRLFYLHAFTGTTILVLMIWRWRLRKQVGHPPSPPGTPEDAKMLASLNHHAFYAVLVMMPVVGWIAANTGGVESWWGRLHQASAALLWALIAAHLAGVAYHSFVRHDRLLGRMT